VSRNASLLDALLGLERPMLVALDVDGTLSPIVRDPDLAEIPGSTLSVLAALGESPMVELALITGRDLGSLSRMEQLEGVWRAVEHGGLVLAPGERPSPRELTSEQGDALDRFRLWVDTHARDAFIEYKPQAIAVHVRGIAESDPARADQLLREADELAPLREAEAVHHDKGSALREIFKRSGARSVFFAGDDLTDFPAINFAAEHGVGAFVRSDEQRCAPSTSAVLLQSVDEIGALLSQLLERITE